MANKLTKPTVTKYHPGQEASPGLPARCYVSGYTPRTDWQDFFSVRYEPMSPAEAYALYAGLTSRPRLASGTRYFWNWSIYCVPEIPASTYSPGYNYVDVRKGWNASADSIFHSPGDFTLAFDYDRFPVGVIVGVAPYPTTGVLPSAVTAGVYLRDGVIDVIAGGLVVGTAPYTPVDQKPITVARRQSEVVVAVGDWTMAVAGLPAGEEAQVRSLLYLAGDYVDNPRFLIEVVARARGSVGVRSRVPDYARAGGSVAFTAAKMEARGSVGFFGRAAGVVDYSATARGSAAFTTTVARPGGEGLVTLPALAVYGGLAGSMARGTARLALPALAVEGDGGYSAPNVVGGAVVIPGLLLSGDVKVGTIGTGELQLPALTAIGADYPYGQGYATLPALEVFGTDPEMPEGHLRMYEGVAASDSMSAVGRLYAVINGALGVSSTISFALLTNAAMYDSLLLQDRLSFAATLYATIRSGLLLSDQAARGDWPDNNAHFAAVQYATNVLTGAVTRLDGFNFSSFCRAGQLAFGVAPDGLYAIEPNEEPIDAIVEFATVGSESMSVKGLEYVYVGASTDGEVYVAVRGDAGGERVYRAIENNDTYRATTGRGLRARQWNVRLEITDATRATLEGVEWIAPATARRWGR